MITRLHKRNVCLNIFEDNINFKLLKNVDKKTILKYYIEMTRNEILDDVDNEFIHHKDHTKDLKIKTGKLKIDSNNFYLNKVVGGTLYFKIRSATRKNKMYDIIVSFTDDYNWLCSNFKFKEYDINSKSGQYKIVVDIKYYFANMIDNGDLLCSCSCPSALYHGYKYLGTQLDYQVRKSKENRPPKIKNPKLKGTVCKHLDLVLKSINGKVLKEHLVEYLTDRFLSREINRRYGSFKNYFWLDHFKYIVK